MADDFPSLSMAAAAPQGKKSQKKSKKGISLDAFLQEQGLGSTGGSWADEMESMPTAPAARDPTQDWADRGHLKDRGFSSRDDSYDRPEVPIPDEAPFTAYTGNLSFETTEADLTDFFSSIGCEQITSVRLVMDRDTGKFKGFAYVEFGLLDDLKKALSQTGNSIGGRPIRVSVAESQKPRASDGAWRRDGPPSGFGGGFGDRGGDRGGFGDRGGYPDRGPPAQERYIEDSDWSSARGGKFVPSAAPAGPPRRDLSTSSARSFGSGFGGEPAGAGDRGGFGSRFTATPPMSGSNSPYGDQSESRRSSVQAGPPAFTEADTSSTWRRAAPPAAAPSSPRASDHRSSPADSGASSPTIPTVRRKLELAPRSTASPPLTSPTAASAKPNPFGAAAPVDTAARERDIATKRAEAQAERERLAKERADVPKSIIARTDAPPAKGETNWRSPAPAPASSAPQVDLPPPVSSPTTSTSSGPAKPKADLTKSVKREGFSFANAAKALAGSQEGANGMATDDANDEELAGAANKLSVAE